MSESEYDRDADIADLHRRMDEMKAERQRDADAETGRALRLANAPKVKTAPKPETAQERGRRWAAMTGREIDRELGLEPLKFGASNAEITNRALERTMAVVGGERGLAQALSRDEDIVDPRDFPGIFGRVDESIAPTKPKTPEEAIADFEAKHGPLKDHL